MASPAKSNKVYIIDLNEESRVPFLRGILTRSLQNAGLSFKDAYTLADDIRGRLEKDITTAELRAMVSKELQNDHDPAILARYRRMPRMAAPIMVVDRDNQPQPFSKAQLSQTLELCAFSPERCYAITTRIEHRLLDARIRHLTSIELAQFTYEYLRDQESESMAHRYMVWLEFSRSGRPLFLLIGGANGSGKSTIGAELAHRLNIVRTQSTDMLREVMRLLVPSLLLPALHTSSFNAWKTLPTTEEAPLSTESHLESGFLVQARQVAVGLEGVLNRAEREGVSLILEGIHVTPAIQAQVRESTDALVVPIVLAVLKRKRLRKRLKGRGQQVSSRRSERYLENFEAIWQLQSFLLSEADRYDIPILENDDQEETIKLVMENISAILEKEYTGDPNFLFEAVD